MTIQKILQYYFYPNQKQFSQWIIMFEYISYFEFGFEFVSEFGFGGSPLFCFVFCPDGFTLFFLMQKMKTEQY